MDLTDLMLPNQKIKIDLARREFEARRKIRFALTLAAGVVSIFAVDSLIGLISSAGLVIVPDSSTTSWSETMELTIFQSGGMGFGIFSSISVLLWIVRAII